MDIIHKDKIDRAKLDAFVSKWCDAAKKLAKSNPYLITFNKNSVDHAGRDWIAQGILSNRLVLDELTKRVCQGLGIKHSINAINDFLLKKEIELKPIDKKVTTPEPRIKMTITGDQLPLLGD